MHSQNKKISRLRIPARASEHMRSNYAYEGQVNGYITGGFPARIRIGNWLSYTSSGRGEHPEWYRCAPPGRNIILWTAVRGCRDSLTENYGFLLSSGASSASGVVMPDTINGGGTLSSRAHSTPAGQFPGPAITDFRKFRFQLCRQ